MKLLQNGIKNYVYILNKLLVKNKRVGVYALLMIVVGLIGFAEVVFPKAVIAALMAEPVSLAHVTAVIGIFFAITTLARASQSFFNNRNNVYLTNLSFYLKADIQEKCMTMDYPYTEEPDVLNMIRNANVCAQESKALVEKFCTVVSSFFILLAYSFLLIHLNIFLLVLVLINMYLSTRFLLWAKNYEAAARNQQADQKRRKDYLFATMFDYNFGKEIRIFNMQDVLSNKYTEQIKKSSKLTAQTETKLFQSNCMDAGLTFLREGFVYALLTFYFFSGRITLDNFALYLGVILSFSVTAKLLIESIGKLVELRPFIVDYKRFVEGEFENQEDEAVQNIPLPLNLSSVSIEFVHVSFVYPHSDRKILDDVSFTISNGSHVSLVGLNGAGKTTIVKLICRFYDPTQGAVLLNGVDIRSYIKAQYIKLISAVFQDSKLFAFTVEENISLDSEGADKKRIWDILDSIGIRSAVEKLDQKEETPVLKNLYDDGVEFSGGEKQRLCIGRAMYKGTKLLLLDEPTAALDALAEKRIYESFSSLSRGSTTLFISHRLNSNRFSDKVIFLDNGRIVSQGRHDQILETCEMYREIYHMQAQYYVEQKEEVL